MATDDVTNLDAAHVPDKTAVDAITGQWNFTKSVATPGGENFIASGELEVWSAGVSSPPDGWTLVGAGASVAQEAAAANVAQGALSALLTRAGTDCYLKQDIVSKAGPIGLWKSRTVVLGAWVKCAAAARARIGINDGAATTFSAYHSGGGAYEWLTISLALGAGITALEARLQIDTGNTTAYFDAIVFTLGSGIPEWMPSAFVASGAAAGSVGFMRPTFRGLRVFSDPDEPTQRMRIVCDELVLIDSTGNGKRFTAVDVMADIGSAGAGGLDTGGVAASTAYDLYVIAKADGTISAMYSKGFQWSKDQDYADSNRDGTLGLRDASGRTQIAQGFKASANGLLHSIEISLLRAASPTGLIWAEIQSDSAGKPSGTMVTGGRCFAMPVNLFDTANRVRMRFCVLERSAVVAGTQYHFVLKGDYTISATNFMNVGTDGSAPTYSNGSVSTFDGATWTADATRDFALFTVNILTGSEIPYTNIPAGYAYVGRVSCALTDGSGNLPRLVQEEDEVTLLTQAEVAAPTPALAWQTSDLATQLPAGWSKGFTITWGPDSAQFMKLARPLPLDDGSITASEQPPYADGQFSPGALEAVIPGWVGPMIWTSVNNTGGYVVRGYKLKL